MDPPTTDAAGGRGIELGLRQNAAQFTLLVVVNALVGGMLGQERTVLPLLGEQAFGIARTRPDCRSSWFSGWQAATDYYAGTWSDRFGRQPVLVAGWLIASCATAPDHDAVLVEGRRRRRLLDISQGLDLVDHRRDEDRPRRPCTRSRDGFRRVAGYGALAVTALATGCLAGRMACGGSVPARHRIAALGLGLSTLAVRETRGYARFEATMHNPVQSSRRPPPWHVGRPRGFRPDQFSEPASPSAASRPGRRSDDGFAWGLFPILFTASGLSVARWASRRPVSAVAAPAN